MFEPAIYQQNQDFDEAMDADETASLHTNVGSKSYEKGGGVSVTD